jgi:putative RecB family exonuclease
MTTYSHSKLAKFENCPRAYKFAYIEKPEVEEFKTVDAFTGLRVHEVLQRLHDDLKYEKHNSLDDLLAYYNELWERNWSNEVKILREGITPENYKQVGERCIRDYYLRYEPFDQGRTVATELLVTIEIEGYKLRGFIDRLAAFPDGLYEIHDYKTSQRLPPQRILDTDRQLALYQVGIQQRWKDVNRVDLVWHYLAFDRELRSERTGEQLEELKQSVLSLIGRIERAEELDDFPTKRSYCNWCEFRDICPEWAHLHKVGALPANEFLKEPGVMLVNEFAKLKARREELEELEKKLREAIITYAKREGVSCIKGSDKKLYVRIGKRIKFPGSKEKGREELEELIRGAGRWEEVSSLDTRTLEKIAREGSWPPELLEKLKQYQSLEESARLKLADLKEKE